MVHVSLVVHAKNISLPISILLETLTLIYIKYTCVRLDNLNLSAISCSVTIDHVVNHHYYPTETTNNFPVYMAYT